MSTDLYSQTPGPYTRACGTENPGTADPNQETCVEYAPLPGGGYALRDTKNPDAGTLHFTRAELDAFVKAYEAL